MQHNQMTSVKHDSVHPSSTHIVCNTKFNKISTMSKPYHAKYKLLTALSPVAKITFKNSLFYVYGCWLT